MEIPQPMMAANLRRRLQLETDRIHDERLPGWEKALADDQTVAGRIGELVIRIENAIRDEDEIRYEKEIADHAKEWERVNGLVAECYRVTNTDPETWELRYIKWMKISFIKFDSPMGEFFLTPHMPKKKPKARHWYTVDEMIMMVRGPIAELIKMSDRLPDRPEVLKPPGPGEKVLHIDATGPTVRTYYEMHKRSRYG